MCFVHQCQQKTLFRAVLIWIVYLNYVPGFCLMDVCFSMRSSVADAGRSLPHVPGFLVRPVQRFGRAALRVLLTLSLLSNHASSPQRPFAKCFVLFFFFTASSWPNSFNVFCANSPYGTRSRVCLCQSRIVLLFS